MKNHRFPWLRNRTTDNRKCEKARNIKEKRTIEMFNTVSRRQEEQASSQRDNLRTAEHYGNLEIRRFLADWIVMKIADFRFVTNTLLTCY